MIGASKILTVSYGTFSCTLEGFDEPFNTMKAIAEYFRDLAAEDRYFGAEPPTPDAAMLHKIAEREIQRRVEAKIEENGVVLRAGELAPAIAAPAPRPAPSVSATATLTESGESVAARLSRLRAAQVPEAAALTDLAPLVEAELPEDLPAYEASADQDYIEDLPEAFDPVAEPETIAAADDTLRDILDAAEVVVLPEPQAEPLAEPEPAPAPELNIAALLQAADALPEAEPDLADDLPEAAESDFDDSMLTAVGDLLARHDEPVPEVVVAEVVAAEPVAVEPVAADLPAEPPPEPAPAPLLERGPESDPLPANVQEAKARARVIRIRRAEPPAVAAVAAAPVKTLLSPEAEAALQAELRALEAELGLDLAEEPEAAAPQPPQPEVIAEADVTDLDVAEPEVAEPEVADLDDEDLPADLPAPQAVQPTFADDLDDEDFDFEEEAPAAETSAAETPVVAAAEVREPLADLSQPATDADIAAVMALDTPAAAETEAARPVRPARPVRSIQVQRPANDASPAAPTEAEPSEDDIRAAISALLNADEPATERRVNPTTPVHDKLRSMLETKAGEDAVSRILAQTNTEMAGAENRRRISAIQHLKAAVAATHADRAVKAAGKAEPAPNPQAAYRNDLVSVTRPARPASDRPAAERPSPLVLVSELRIDRPKPQPLPQSAPAPRVVMPSRPRRLGATGSMAAQAEDSIFGMDDEDDVLLPGEGGSNMFDGQNSFADFAESLGATSLQDLLEASAVYCGEVLGREYFSRLQVIQQLENLEAAPPRNRDDELRAFGSLMRQGRIVKVKRGQFAITTQSPLLAEAKRQA